MTLAVRLHLALVLSFALFATSALAAPTAAVPTAVAVNGSDLLQPEDANFADYRSAEAEVFKEVFADNVVVRAVVEPSFQNEFAVGLTSDNGAYRVFVLEPSAQIWSYTILKMMKDGKITSTDSEGHSTTSAQIAQLEARLPPNPEDLKVSRCEIAVPDGIGERIVQAWRTMLAKTAVTATMGLDGTIYHFAMRDSGRVQAGQVWSPSENTNPWRLVLIMQAMKLACRTKSDALLLPIPGMTDEIQAHLK
jgi:hypothetical protein